MNIPCFCDDVMSELDEIRQLECEYTAKSSNLYYRTNLDNLDKSAIKEVKLFRVTNGCEVNNRYSVKTALQSLMNQLEFRIK